MKPLNIFNKWWLMLTEGVFLIILSYFLFSQHGKSMESTVTIAGFIALLTGSVVIIGFFLTGKNEKNILDPLVGICCCIAGLLLLSSTSFASELITWFFAVYMLLTSVKIISTAWILKDEIHWWWLTLVLAISTLAFLYFLICGKTLFNITVTVLAAVQFFISGMLTIVFAFVVRKLQYEYSKPISQLRRQ